MFEDDILAISSDDNIPSHWRQTPIEQFIKAHNSRQPIFAEPRAKVLISACMDCRYNIPIPKNFAYVIRTPGGRLIGFELAIGYAIFRGIENIILVAHNDCGMTKLQEFAPNLVQVLIKEGWSEQKAIDFVENERKRLAFNDEVEALREEYLRLRDLFSSIKIAPLFLNLSDQKIYLPKWYNEIAEQVSHVKALREV